MPALEFLDYLGSWQESDEEWLIVAEWEDEKVGAREETRELRGADDE